MSANQAVFPIATMARVLGLSKAGFYAWRHRPPSLHDVADAALLRRVRTVHASSRQTYGAPRVHADLRHRGERHRRKRIARLMRDAGLDRYRSIEAIAESFFSTLESELLSRRRFASQAEARMACFSCIEGWYNPARLHSGLGYWSPMADEKMREAAMIPA